MYAAHALFEAIGIPWNIIVEKDIADLEIYPFACRLSSSENLDPTLPKFLLRIKACPRFVTRTRPHSAMNAPDFKAP
jgi:hypothetical protein